MPILEFVHAVQQAGVAASSADILARPQEHWELMPELAQALFLVGRGLPGTARYSVSVVRRRGRALVADNVLVRFDPVKTPPWTHRAAEAVPAKVLFSPLTAEALAAEVVPLSGPHVAAVAPAFAQAPLYERMRAAWGNDDEADAALAGPPLVEFVPGPGYEEVERYWAQEHFSLIVILLSPERELVYHVEEPRLSGFEKALLLTVNDRLRDVLLLQEPGDATSRGSRLLENVFDLLRAYRYRTDARTAFKLGYYFARNYLGIGRLEPMMHDAFVEDVSCNGAGLPVFVAHSRHQNLRSNLSFEELELNSFTMKLAQRGGKLLSVAQPMVDATLPDGSRLQACLGREVTSRGSAFTIRRFREDPLTCVDLVRGGTHSVETMAFLWLAVEWRASILVMGATASGKTTTLNCLSQFIPPALKIVTIEDTREITLQHENWLASVTRDSASSGAERVSMYHLLRAALRQRPEYILVGEVRGEEGLTLFQAMSTGHTCYSSMHAGSVENAVYRLENDPIRVPRVMLSSLDFFLLQGQVEHRGRLVRRMLGLTEVRGVDPQTRNLRLNEVYRWRPEADEHVQENASGFLEDARARRGWSRARLEDELDARRRVLQGLVERGERHYSDVARAIRRFYGSQPIPLAVLASKPTRRPLHREART